MCLKIIDPLVSFYFLPITPTICVTISRVCHAGKDNVFRNNHNKVSFLWNSYKFNSWLAWTCPAWHGSAKVAWIAGLGIDTL